MKGKGTCPKCQGTKIGRAKSILDSEHHDVHLGEGRDGPLWGLIGKKHSLKLEAYICTDCGYVETYIKSPEGIKWEAIKNFEWIGSGQSNDATASPAASSETEEPSSDDGASQE